MTETSTSGQKPADAHSTSELRRNAHVLVLQEMRARFTDTGSPSRTAALDAAISALAAHQLRNTLLPDDPRVVEKIAAEIERGKFDHPGFYRNTQLAEALRRVLDAALFAHPSPGGQGDALLREVSGQLESLDCGACIGSDAPMEDLHGRIAAHLAARQPETAHAAYHTGKAIGRREAELEARQPVGEPAAFVEHFTDRLSTLNLTHAGLELGVGKHALYAASPAQAVDLGQLPHGIRFIEIPCRNNLDPINVFVQDYELGRGRIVVTCYGQAWCGFWGAMGDRTVMQFVAACDADYVAGNMLSGRHEHVKKHERVYVERIAAEVIAEFRALIDSQAVGNG